MTEKTFTDFNSIIEEFSGIEDPRSTINRRHLLGDLIVISIMAFIADVAARCLLRLGLRIKWSG